MSRLKPPCTPSPPEMSNCSNHRKDVHGETDMKHLAEEIGNLHYESLQNLFFELSIKLYQDGVKDTDNGRVELGAALDHASDHLSNAAHCMQRAWKVCEPFMKQS